MAKINEKRVGMVNINPFGLRLQPDLKARLEAGAAEAGRSLNSEIVARLEGSYGQSNGSDSDLLDIFSKVINEARLASTEMPVKIRAGITPVLDALSAGVYRAKSR